MLRLFLDLGIHRCLSIGKTSGWPSSQAASIFKSDAQSHIDRRVKGRNCFAHAKPLKRLAPAQQFAVDPADRLQDLAGTVMIGQELCRLGVKLLRDVVHLRPQSRVAD